MKRANKNLALFGTLGALCGFSFLLRLPSFDFPLDYDVGGHLFYGMMVAKEGFYSTLQEIRPVGILAIFALIYKFFGSSTFWIYVVGASFWILSTYLLYKIAENIFESKRIALFSSLIFTFLASSRALQGEMANMETFFIPFNLVGIYFFFLAKRKAKKACFALGGFSFGVAFLIKHLAVFDLLAVGLFNGFFLMTSGKGLSRSGRPKKVIRLFVKESVFLASGFFISILLVVFYFLFIGQLGDFFYWQFIRIFRSVSGYPFLGNPLVNLKNNFLPIFGKTYVFWLLSFLGMISTLIFKRETKRLFLLFWFLSVFSGIYYLWWFFPHHFLQLTPSVSILAGLFLSDIYTLKEKRLSRSWLRVKNGVIVIGLFLGLVLFLKADSPYFVSYFQKLRGRISREEHLAAVGFNVGPNGWLPLYETANYLKKETKPEDTIFLWGSVPTLYALAEKQPISWFVYKYPLLPDELRTRTFQGWFPDVEENRERLMNELLTVKPDYLVLEVEQRKIFDEMLSFGEFSAFINQNYVFAKRIGNIFVFKIEGRGRIAETESQTIHLELVKRFAAITKVEERKGLTEITFEPMISTGGVLRVMKVVYPGEVEINFEPFKIEFLGQDGGDFVGNSAIKPSGEIDLHFRVLGQDKPASLIRIKSDDDAIWNSQQSGLYSPIKVIKNGNIFDLYIEAPSRWKEKSFNVYFIYEDGNIASGDVES